MVLFKDLKSFRRNAFALFFLFNDAGVALVKKLFQIDVGKLEAYPVGPPNEHHNLGQDLVAGLVRNLAVLGWRNELFFRHRPSSLLLLLLLGGFNGSIFVARSLLGFILDLRLLCLPISGRFLVRYLLLGLLIFLVEPSFLATLRRLGTMGSFLSLILISY